MTDYIKKHGVPDEEIGPQPRKLTRKEISEILDVIPGTIAPNEEISKMTREASRDHIYGQLRKITISPDERALTRLKEFMIDRYNISKVKPGKPVGTAAAEAFGASSTQATLNTFHKAGVANTVSTGFVAMKELFYARKNRKIESCTIHFKNRSLSLDDIYDLRPEFVGVTVGDFIKEMEIESPENLAKFWWHSHYDLESEKFDAGIIMRIHLDVTKMYAFRVSIIDLCKRMYQSRPRMINCIHGSLSDGIIDIYPDIDIIKREQMKHLVAVGDDVILRFFFRNFLQPEIKKDMMVKGIKNIIAFTPIAIDVWAGIRNVAKVSQSDLENFKATIPGFEEHVREYVREHFDHPLEFYENRIWMLRKHDENIMFQGLGDDLIARFFGRPEIDIQILLSTETFYLCIMPEKAGKSDPESYITGIMKIENDQIERERDELRKAGKPPIIKQSDLHRAGRYVYAITIGSNLMGIMRSRIVDRTRTTCNNMHVLARVFGIEAMRQYYVYDLMTVIRGSGEDINFRHISLVADFVVGRGVPLGITFAGISRQPGGHLTKAVIERSTEVLTKSALFGHREDIKSAAASTIVGQKPFLGTGAYKFGVEFTSEEEEDVLNAARTNPDEEGKTFTLETLNDGLDALELLQADLPILDRAPGESAEMNNVFREGAQLPDMEHPRTRPVGAKIFAPGMELLAKQRTDPAPPPIISEELLAALGELPLKIQEGPGLPQPLTGGLDIGRGFQKPAAEGPIIRPMVITTTTEITAETSVTVEMITKLEPLILGTGIPDFISLLMKRNAKETVPRPIITVPTEVVPPVIEVVFAPQEFAVPTMDPLKLMQMFGK